MNNQAGRSVNRTRFTDTFSLGKQASVFARNGIFTEAQLASRISVAITQGELKLLAKDRTAWWHNGLVVISNPGAVNGGTAFFPTAGYAYFERLQ